MIAVSALLPDLQEKTILLLQSPALGLKPNLVTKSLLSSRNVSIILGTKGKRTDQQ